MKNEHLINSVDFLKIKLSSYVASETEEADKAWDICYAIERSIKIAKEHEVRFSEKFADDPITAIRWSSNMIESQHAWSLWSALAEKIDAIRQGHSLTSKEEIVYAANLILEESESFVEYVRKLLFSKISPSVSTNVVGNASDVLFMSASADVIRQVESVL